MLRNKTTDQADQVNPNLAAIDTAWASVRSAMATYDGAYAARLMADLAERDESQRTTIANGVYWRIQDWFEGWFRAHDQRTTDIRFPRVDFSYDAFVNWIRRLYPNASCPEHFESAQLPYILQELSKHAEHLRHVRTQSLEGVHA